MLEFRKTGNRKVNAMVKNNVLFTRRGFWDIAEALQTITMFFGPLERRFGAWTSTSCRKKFIVLESCTFAMKIDEKVFAPYYST